MKIKRGRLQQIIQEELKRVLKEERNEPYMVVAKDLRGELVFHDASGRPNNLTPKIYDYEKDAVQFSINQTSKTKTAGSDFTMLQQIFSNLRTGRFAKID